MACFFTAFIVTQQHFTGAAHYDQTTLAIFHHVFVGEFQFRIVAGFNRRLFCTPLRCTTDVEGTHGELCTRFTDGLSSDNTHCFTEVDRRAACQIAAIAFATDAFFGFTGKHRANHHRFNAALINGFDCFLIDQLAGFHDQFFSRWVQHILRRCTAKDFISQRNQHFATFNDGFGNDAFFGAAIIDGNDAILRHIHQTAGEVTGVCGFQRRIGQAFTRPVG